mgnify:CR=1 FL=1
MAIVTEAATRVFWMGVLNLGSNTVTTTNTNTETMDTFAAFPTCAPVLTECTWGGKHMSMTYFSSSDKGCGEFGKFEIKSWSCVMFIFLC